MKFSTIATSVGLIAVILVGFLLSSCQNSISPGNNPVSSSQTGTIEGKIITTNNSGVSGLEVRVGSLIAYTNNKGEFYLPNVPTGNRVLVSISSESYVSTQKIVVVKPNKTTYVDAAVLLIGTKQNLNATTGGTISFSGATVTFPANALVDSKGNPFTGTAQVRATYFNPTSNVFYGCFPGEFTGIRQNRTETAIESFGFVHIDILNATEKLQLAVGQQSSITFPIPSALLGKAPQTIPLWYYDEVKGQWIEDGSATKTGNVYVGTVSHFSSWNCDQPTQTSFLEGTVVDKNGNPLSFATVHATGVDYTGSSKAYTDDNGKFKIAVKSASTASVWASFYIVSGTSQNVVTPATGLTLDIGTLMIPLDTMDFCSIIGTVIDNGNLPVQNISVQLKDNTGKVIDYNYTTKDGKFKFFGETGKSYTIQIATYADSGKTSVITVDVTCPAQPGTVDVGNIKLDIGGSTIIGRVVDANGTPLENVNIFASVSNGNPGQAREIRTDATGTFSLWVRPNVSVTINFYYMQKLKTMVTTSGNLGETKDIGDIQIP